MPTWAGWEVEFLTAGQMPNTAENRRFLDEWAAHAETGCRRNPIDLSAQTAGSSNCRALPAVTARAQNYSSHANAAHAFFVQTHRASTGAILAALESGDPYTVSNTGTVATQLTSWGSQTFAHFYFTETATAPGRGGGGTGIKAPHALGGWGDLKTQVDSTFPTAVRAIGRANKAGLSALARRSRVRH